MGRILVCSAPRQPRVTIDRRLAARLIKRVPMHITLAMDSSAESVLRIP
jgi:hypothetical protein